MAKLTGRDYKQTQRRALEVRRYRQFLYGAGVGVLVTCLAFVYAGSRQHPGQPTAAGRDTQPAVLAAAAGGTGADGAAATFTDPEMLAKSQVPLPGKDQHARRELAAGHRTPGAAR